MRTYYPQPKKYKEGPRRYTTKEGEHVYSKGELEIANFLHDQGIDYHYEFLVEIDNVPWHPDFFLWRLNMFIEFQGMADDEKSRKRYAARHMAFKSKDYKVMYLYQSQLGHLGEIILKKLEEFKISENDVQ